MTVYKRSVLRRLSSDALKRLYLKTLGEMPRLHFNHDEDKLLRAITKALETGERIPDDESFADETIPDDDIQ